MPQIDHIVLAVGNLDAAARAFEAAGFTVTPRAEHPWGTANRLVQFRAQNFIEILEVDRPALLFEHEPRSDPPRFSFGAFNRDFLESGEGMSMLVLTGNDAQGDVARFRAAGLQTYAPFEFEREARLPDGSALKVAFALAFASHGECPRAGFFTCHNRYPENFWRSEYQVHANGATGIAEAVLVARSPRSLQDFVAGFTGGDVCDRDGGIAAACGPHRLTVLAPDAWARRFPGADADLSEGPRFGAVVLDAAGEPEPLGIHGLAIGWARAASRS